MKEESEAAIILSRLHLVIVRCRQERGVRYVIKQNPFLRILVYGLFLADHPADGVLQQFTFITIPDGADAYVHTIIDNNRSD